MFTPGTVVHSQERDGKKIVIRYPKWEDLSDLLKYARELAAQDLYMLLTDAEITEDEEADYLAQKFKQMEAGNEVYLELFVDGKLAGSCQLERDQNNRMARLHVGKFGISLREQYRGQGLGELLARSTIGEAQQHIDGLQIIELFKFGANTAARHLYDKLGFQEVGRMPGGITHKNTPQDYVWMYLNVG